MWSTWYTLNVYILTQYKYSVRMGGCVFYFVIISWYRWYNVSTRAPWKECLILLHRIKAFDSIPFSNVVWKRPGMYLFKQGQVGVILRKIDQNWLMATLRRLKLDFWVFLAERGKHLYFTEEISFMHSVLFFRQKIYGTYLSCCSFLYFNSLLRKLRKSKLNSRLHIGHEIQNIGYLIKISNCTILNDLAECILSYFKGF